ncbi:MAG: CapA family protein [Bacteroidales bacterium]|nr:CapA family protein [Bacteroidales bacterium]
MSGIRAGRLNIRIIQVVVVVFCFPHALFSQISYDRQLITIAATGDIMPGTSFPGKSYLPPGNNPYPLMSSLFEILSLPDLTFGNLEGPFSDDGELAKKCRDTTTCYAFRVPESYAGVLDSAGFDLLSLANNHIGDFGYEAKLTTATILDSMNMSFAGTDDYPLAVRTLFDTLKVGFCAFAPNKGTVNLHDIKRVEELIGMLEDTCDIVVASVHAGGEGAENQHVTRTEEYYYGENRGNIYEFAHRLIDLGADIVLGHGPHVSRALEIYRGRLIAYSLGNFCTYRRFNLRGPNGYAPLIYACLDTEGEFLFGKIIPVYQNNMGHVKQDPEKRAIFKIQELIQSDFPESKLVVDNDGNITIKE